MSLPDPVNHHQYRTATRIVFVTLVVSNNPSLTVRDKTAAEDANAARRRANNGRSAEKALEVVLPESHHGTREFQGRNLKGPEKQPNDDRENRLIPKDVPTNFVLEKVPRSEYADF